MRAQSLKSKKLQLRNPELNDRPKHPEKFIMEYREKQRNYANQKKRSHQAGSNEILNKVVIAVRLRGSKNLSDRQMILLKTLKLKKIHDAALIKVDKNNERYLKICEPFITFG